MNTLPEKIEYLVKLMGLKDASVDFDAESRRISIIADEDEWFKNQIPSLVKDFKHLIALMAHKEESYVNYFVDINNYRKEREKIIVKLALAAAQKATLEKKEVRLPAMNAYERRLVHMELSMRPDIQTESDGQGKERCVIIKPII